MRYVVTYNKPFSHEVHYANTLDEAKTIIKDVYTREEWKDLRLFKIEEELRVHHLLDKAFPSGNQQYIENE